MYPLLPSYYLPLKQHVRHIHDRINIILERSRLYVFLPGWITILFDIMGGEPKRIWRDIKNFIYSQRQGMVRKMKIVGLTQNVFVEANIAKSESVTSHRSFSLLWLFQLLCISSQNNFLLKK